MRPYYANDLVFTVPPETRDRTVHRLELPGTATEARFCVTVTREKLAAGEQLADRVAQLHRKEACEMAAYRVLGSRVETVNGHAWLDTKITWKLRGEEVYHRQAHSAVDDVWLSLTVTATVADSGAADELAEHILSTFRFR